MKRRLLTILIFLIAGAVVNIAVAWGCVLWVPDYKRTHKYPRRAADKPHETGPSEVWYKMVPVWSAHIHGGLEMESTWVATGSSLTYTFAWQAATTA